MTKTEEYKRMAAEAAVEAVKPGMVVGLGTGSTANYAITRIAKLLKSGELTDIIGIPSSVPTNDLASSLGIPLATFADHSVIDITIDGADEVDKDLNLIKGGGGALLQEKILAQVSREVIIIVDEGKLSDKLGTRFPLPVEVVPFGLHTEKRFLESLGAKVSLRENVIAKPFRTDHRNLILDAEFGPIDDPYALAEKLSRRAGVVEHGLFLGVATEVVVAGKNGITRLKKKG
ncbi:MAG: ribose-5-phosphate isomerase RpiA [Deltaproteobacteria bacterium]|nr:ribose-5-phosphate isomerase RpiA [Deltaproteobacteria bacterium]